MTNSLKVMDASGHLEVKWDTERDTEVETARKIFNDNKKKGYIAYRRKPNGGEGSLMNEFDPNAGEIIMRPPIQGG